MTVSDSSSLKSATEQLHHDLDREVLHELFAIIRTQHMREHILNSFKDSGRNNVDALKKAAQAGDHQEFLVRAHSIKGTAGTLGILTLSHKCKHAESSARTMEPDALQQLAHEIEHTFMESYEQLQSYIRMEYNDSL